MREQTYICSRVRFPSNYESRDNEQAAALIRNPQSSELQHG